MREVLVHMWSSSLMELTANRIVTHSPSASRRRRFHPRAVLSATLLILVGCLIWSAHADAAGFGPAEETAWEEAQAYWKATPTLCSSLSREVVPAGSLDGPEVGVLGRASQPEAPTACSIRIVEGLSGTDLCAVMTHEYGHLLGYSHADPEMAVLYTCAAPVTAGVDLQAATAKRWTRWKQRQAACERSPSAERQKCLPRLRHQAQRFRSTRPS